MQMLYVVSKLAIKKAQIGNDQENAQSDTHTKKSYKPSEQLFPNRRPLSYKKIIYPNLNYENAHVTIFAL